MGTRRHPNPNPNPNPYPNPNQVTRAGVLDEPLGEVLAGEGFGESSLLDGKQRRTKSVTCASPYCEVTSIRGGEFLRMVDKSRLVRDSFESLHQRRRANNAATIAASRDPILEKYTRR